MNQFVIMESTHGNVSSAEISLYVGMFEHLRQSAVHGAQARALITRAITDLANEKSAAD